MISNSNNTSGKTLIAAGMMALCVVSACPVGVYARAPQQKQSEQQLKTITGVIVDARTHEPLIGATVMVKGTAVGTASDIDGNFSINVVPGSTLLVSYTGYQSLECKASDNMTISLTESTSNLDEVVVVGYGVQKKGTLTGSVSSVKGSDLKTSGVANVTNTFAGQIPGVVANTRSGEPGSDWSNIYIRGKGTLNDNSPLIIIDVVDNRD